MDVDTILAAGFLHETNTFATTATDRGAFQKQHEYFGETVSEKLRGTNTQMGGILEVADAREAVDVIHPVFAEAVPGGVVTEAAYEFYTDAILESIETNRHDIAGVVLALHGAMVAESTDDGEGRLIEDIRTVIGPATPLVVGLDLHGNVSQTMVEAADALVAFETYPHVDLRETGATAARLLLDTIHGRVAPVTHWERPPVLALGPKQTTREGPMADVMADARRYEQRPEVLKVNVFLGFHQADVAMMGASIPVVTDDDPRLAREISRALARGFWERRSAFVGDYPAPAEAVARAKEHAGRPSQDGFVLLADIGDNPGGGGAADGTVVLRELIEQRVENAGLALIRDPEVVETCIEAGVGARTVVDLGGKADDLHGPPIEALDVYVKAITDGEFVNVGPMSTGSEVHLGRAVLVQCGHEDGVAVIVTENRHQPYDTEIWRHVGVQPERLDVVAIKSSNHYRADYEPRWSVNIPVDSPGLVAMDPRRFEYEHIRRPQYPLDDMTEDDYPDW